MKNENSHGVHSPLKSYTVYLEDFEPEEEMEEPQPLSGKSEKDKLLDAMMAGSQNNSGTDTGAYADPDDGYDMSDSDGGRDAN